MRRDHLRNRGQILTSIIRSLPGVPDSSPNDGAPMSDRYIPGVPCWIDTTQPDPDAAAAFYGELFGWELENVMPEGSPKYFIARLGGKDVGAVSALPPGAPESAAWNTYVWVDSADETAEKVRAAGGSVLMEPGDIGESGRMAVFADPGGAAFSVWQAKQHRGAGVVNEPRSEERRV